MPACAGQHLWLGFVERSVALEAEDARHELEFRTRIQRNAWNKITSSLEFARKGMHTSFDADGELGDLLGRLARFIRFRLRQLDLLDVQHDRVTFCSTTNQDRDCELCNSLVMRLCSLS